MIIIYTVITEKPMIGMSNKLIGCSCSWINKEDAEKDCKKTQKYYNKKYPGEGWHSWILEHRAF